MTIHRDVCANCLSYIAQAEMQKTDEVGEGHILHPINDEQVVSGVVDFFLQRQLSIADGHRLSDGIAVS